MKSSKIYEGNLSDMTGETQATWEKVGPFYGQDDIFGGNVLVVDLWWKSSGSKYSVENLCHQFFGGIVLVEMSCLISTNPCF